VIWEIQYWGDLAPGKTPGGGEGERHGGVDVRPGHGRRRVDGDGDRETPAHAGGEEVADHPEQDCREEQAAAEEHEQEDPDRLPDVFADPRIPHVSTPEPTLWGVPR